jgi:hypothetical protein
MNALALALLMTLLAAIADAAPIELGKDIKVMCGTVQCGTMQFTKYETYELSASGGEPAQGGVRILGQFSEDKPKTYHYIQSVNRHTAPPLWGEDGKTPMPVPWIDAPPGGYDGGDFHDFFVYYDESEFPKFDDNPGGSVGLLKKLKADGKKLESDFETWLVCVIEEKLGEEPFKANDDRYKVAALLGWTWGFTVEYKDNGDGVDDAKDIFAEKGPLQTIDAPSGSWKKALDAVYGTKDKNDRFNVTLGACADCVATPSAPSGALLLGAIVAGWVASRSRRRWSGARHHVQ